MMSKSAIHSFHDQLSHESTESSLHISKIPSRVNNDLLTANEQRQLEDYSYPKRRDEWLAGRIAAKNATVTQLQKKQITLQCNAFEIKNREDGRPYLSLPETIDNSLDVSISHSKEYGIAIVSNDACGIDIQKKSATLQKVEDRFCALEELNILEEYFDREKLTLLTKLWAAKEAIKKAASISGTMLGFNTLKLLSITPGKNLAHFQFKARQQIIKMPDNYLASVTFFKEYALAVCTIKALPAEILEKKNA